VQLAVIWFVEGHHVHAMGGLVHVHVGWELPLWAHFHLDMYASRNVPFSEQGIVIHLDGARIFNAAAALGVDVKEITSKVTSVQLCLSKVGLTPSCIVLQSPASEGISFPIFTLTMPDHVFVLRIIEEMAGNN
jgi:hypothetical protein